jgi:hypothetical protein
MHICWPPRFARVLVQRLQRRWRSLWQRSGNRRTMAWATPTPPPADHWKSVKVPHAQLILHQQPLTTRAHRNVLRGYSSRSCAGDPLLVIDHRIMLDVEFVPGPSLLSSFRAFPGTESVSWGESHGLPCLKSVSVWQLHKTELFEGMYSPKFQCLHPSCANVL